MSAGWVAGTVRAEALSRRRLGAAGARGLAGLPALQEAVAALGPTPYAHDLPSSSTLSDLQHGVTATLLWHLRVLAGWLPRDGVEVLRLLAAGFEVANVDEHLAGMQDQPGDPPYRLGSLETAWSRLADTTSPSQVRQVLSTSTWGDPGASDRHGVGVAMRLAWADRVAAGVPDAAAWARAAAALMLVQETQVRRRGISEEIARRAGSVLGPRFVTAVDSGASLAQLAGLLAGDAGRVFADAERPEDLWRVQVAWYRRVERESLGLLRGSGFGIQAVVGTVGALAVDAWRVRAALAAAERGGAGPALEAFDAVA